MNTQKEDQSGFFLSNIEYLVGQSTIVKSMSALATMIDCDRSTFNKLRNRRSMPKTGIIQSCAYLFNVPIETLINDDIKKFKTNNPFKYVNIIDSFNGDIISKEKLRENNYSDICIKFPSD